MSRKRRDEPPAHSEDTAADPEMLSEDTAPPEPLSKAKLAGVARRINPQRHCPLCWHGQRGHGVCYTKQGRKSYYRCCRRINEAGELVKEGCGHTWSVTVDYRAVRVDTYHAPEIQERAA